MIVGNPGLDFFEQNPVLAYKTEFADLIADLGKEKASKVAWAVYMVEDPDSPLFRIPISERIAEVKLNYKIDVTGYEEFRISFRRLAIPKEAALFKVHMEKLDELTTHLGTLDLTVEKELKSYINIMDKLSKIYKALETVRINMIDHQNKKEVYGGASRSARENR